MDLFSVDQQIWIRRLSAIKGKFCDPAIKDEPATEERLCLFPSLVFKCEFSPESLQQLRVCDVLSR